MTVTILRRTLVGGDTAPADKEAALARDMGSSVVRLLRSVGNRLDVFVIADWPTRDAARAYVDRHAAGDSALAQSDEGRELRSATGDFHLATLEEHR